MLFGFNLEISVTKRSQPLGKKEFSHDEHRQRRHAGRRGFEPRTLASPRIRPTDIPAPGRFKSLTCSEHAALAERVSILALQPDPYDARGFAYPAGVRGTLQRAAQIHAALAALPPDVLPTTSSEAQS